MGIECDKFKNKIKTASVVVKNCDFNSLHIPYVLSLYYILHRGIKFWIKDVNFKIISIESFFIECIPN